VIRWLLAALLLALPAQAEWPERAIRIIVPFPPGGGTDNVARVLAQHLQTALGQPVAVENRSGASGVIGTEAVARAAPDGYTLAMTASGPLSILPQMLPNISYDPVTSFAQVAIPSIGPLLMVQPMDRAPRNVAEFLAWARANPGRVNACSIGIASPSHLAAEMFFRGVGIDFTHVPHRGSGPALTDTIAGHCALLFDSVGSAGPQVREGRLRALAITSAARNPGWPDLPTIAESALPGYEAVTWSGLVAPAGTPAAIVERLNAESRAVFSSPRARAPLEAQGAVISDLTPAAMRDFLQAEIARWGAVIRAGNIKAD
jgi:tripartite-type tricarboxylate transporter receptor subunit TctC